MKILSITAGAAGMYCGSCFRDNALAAELLARGHDVTLRAGLHADAHRRAERQPPTRAVRRHQRLPAAVRRRSSARRRASSIGCGTRRAVIGAFAGRARLDRSRRLLGDLTISMLEGERGVLRKEFDKLVDWIARRAAARRHQPAQLAADRAWRRRCARRTGRPVCCTLQGEELFLERPAAAPYRDQALALIRQQVPHVDRFIAVSDYCAPFMSELLRDSRRRASTVVPLGINMTGYERRDARATTCSASATSRASRRRRGCTCWPTPTSRFRRRIGDAPVRARGRRLPGAGAGGVSGRRRARSLAERRPRRASSRYHGAVDRDGQARVSARARRAVGAGDLRRAEGDVPARGDGERRARRAAAPRRVHRDRREDRRRPARRRRTIPTASPTACTRCGATAIARARSGAARSTACARTTRSQQSAARLLEVYQATLGERRTSLA